MRFCKGEPIAEEFHPERDAQWRRLNEPPIGRFQLWGSMAQVIVLPCLILAWWWPFRQAGVGLDEWFGPAFPWAMCSYPLLVVLHEVLHMLVHPGAGTRPASVLGVLPAHYMFYAAYMQEMSRNRLLGVLIAPFLLLTLLPWMVCLWRGVFSPYWAVLSVLNGAGAVGDLLGIYLLVRGVPSKSIVRNQGWTTWWRACEE